MKVVKPTVITSAMLVSTSAVELYGAWNAATVYALNAYCTLASSNRIYQCIQGPSTNNAPATSPLYWADVGPMNQWAMFDDKISTATTAPASLTVVLDTGFINSLALFGLVGATATITATNGAGGPVVYSATIGLDGTIVADWYQYFFEPFVQLGSLVLTNIPPYSALRLTVTVTGSTAAIGNLVVGTSYDLGDTQLGATVGIMDYSQKTTDAFGNTTFAKRAYSKRNSVQVMFDNGQMTKVQSVLEGLRATPCVWIGVDDAKFLALLVFGLHVNPMFGGHA